MSQFLDYINRMLKTEYTQLSVLKQTEDSSITVYTNNESGKKLVIICSPNRNDHIYRTLRGKENPNTACIYDVSSEDDCVVVLEEFVEGETLSVKLENGPIQEGDAVGYMLDICSALSFIHGAGIVHRDIKPSNIIINSENRAVLIDYSSARELSYTNDSDTVNLGTPGYAAPEQYGVYQSLPATDIYAMGVLFNEMLLGINPIIKTPKGRLGKIIRKCTSSQIAERYQSVDELEKALKKCRKRR